MNRPPESGAQAGDPYLRKHGFVIHLRPRGGEAIWKKRQAGGWQYYRESLAIELAKRWEEERRKA